MAMMVAMMDTTTHSPHKMTKIHKMVLSERDIPMSFSTRVLKGLPDAIGLAVVAAVLAALLALGIGFGPGTYVELGGDPQANTWHGLPDNNPGNGGSSANPNGNGVNDGNGIHGIANNPGQSGDSPADQGNPSCNMHNGFNGDDTKSQCP